MPNTRNSEVSISYDDRGHSEPALLFTPGRCATKAAFGRLPQLCAAQRRTIALDWRGHGDSGPHKQDFGNEGLLADALAAIEESNVDRIIPVALAHSGWIAIELRRRLGNRIPKLVLLSWIVTDPPPQFLTVLRGRAARSARHTPKPEIPCGRWPRSIRRCPFCIFASYRSTHRRGFFRNNSHSNILGLRQSDLTPMGILLHLRFLRKWRRSSITSSV